MDISVRRPGLSAAICAVLAVTSLIAIILGVIEMNVLGRETGFSAGAIGIGLFVAIISTALYFNFAWALRIRARLRRGEGVVGRWRLDAQDIALFHAWEAQLDRAERADWSPPKRPDPEDLEVIFGADGVVVGNDYITLAKSGLARFTDVRLVLSNAAWLEFRTIFTEMNARSGLTTDHAGLVRIPVSDDGREVAREVMTHFRNVLDGVVVTNPGFWPRRIRLGLWAAGLGGVSFVLGMSLKDLNQQLHNVPLFMAVIGAIVGMGGLVLAYAAWRFLEFSKRKI